MNNPQTRTHLQIVAKFDELVEQRDKAEPYSAARKMLNERVRALGWVLQHPEVSELTLTSEAFDIYNCLS